jgi:hypothetical protein
VQAGLDKARRDLQGNGGPRRDRRDLRGTLVNDIASATGVDAAKVRAALQSLKPHRGGRRDRGGDVRGRLAAALGVGTDALDAALRKVRTEACERFATELAQRLKVDVQTVSDALASLPGPGRHHA